jgi:hypothetical protein
MVLATARKRRFNQGAPFFKANPWLLACFADSTGLPSHFRCQVIIRFRCTTAKRARILSLV